MSPHPFNTAPTAEEVIPLREKLPNISAATQMLLIEWVRRQPDAMAWVMRRSVDYFDKFAGSFTPREWALLEATAALDLLRWQSGCQTDLAAVVRLRDLDEAAKAIVASYMQCCDATFTPWITRTPGVKWGKGEPRYRTSERTWDRVRQWNRLDSQTSLAMECQRQGRRPRILCASLADWLDEEAPIPWLADLLRLIHETPNLDWLLLTKRPENWTRRMIEARHYLATPRGQYRQRDTDAAIWLNDWLPKMGSAGMPARDGIAPANVWFGVSVEDQARADKRIPELLKIPARVRFLSVEPLLGPVDLSRGKGVDWIIVGGGGRWCNVDWIRSVVAHCNAAGVPCFVKQLGANAVQPTKFCDGSTVGMCLRHPKGGDPAEWPEDLRLREFPDKELKITQSAFQSALPRPSPPMAEGEGNDQ